MGLRRKGEVRRLKGLKGLKSLKGLKGLKSLKSLKSLKKGRVEPEIIASSFLLTDV